MGAIVSKLAGDAVERGGLTVGVVVVTVSLVLANCYADLMGDLRKPHGGADCWAVGKARTVPSLIAI